MSVLTCETTLIRTKRPIWRCQAVLWQSTCGSPISNNIKCKTSHLDLRTIHHPKRWRVTVYLFHSNKRTRQNMHHVFPIVYGDRCFHLSRIDGEIPGLAGLLWSRGIHGSNEDPISVTLEQDTMWKCVISDDSFANLSKRVIDFLG